MGFPVLQRFHNALKRGRSAKRQPKSGLRPPPSDVGNVLRMASLCGGRIREDRLSELDASKHQGPANSERYRDRDNGRPKAKVARVFREQYGVKLFRFHASPPKSELFSSLLSDAKR
jgi:hypothetical protein